MISLLAFLVFVSCASTREEGADNLVQVSREEKVLRLIDIMGGDTMLEESMRSMIGPMKAMMPEVEPEWWELFLSKALETDLMERMVPLYTRHFTDDEIDAMAGFYGSPTGQAILAKLPRFMEDTMYLSQEWSMEVLQEMLDELESQGHAVPENLIE